MNPETRAHEQPRRLGITTTTLYVCANGDGTPKEVGRKLLVAEDWK